MTVKLAIWAAAALLCTSALVSTAQADPVLLESATLRMSDLKCNEDGSIDLHVGQDAPAGLESNHLKTVGDDGWLVYFRLYAPEQPFFDKTFALDGFEMVE